MSLTYWLDIQRLGESHSGVGVRSSSGCQYTAPDSTASAASLSFLTLATAACAQCQRLAVDCGGDRVRRLGLRPADGVLRRRAVSHGVGRDDPHRVEHALGQAVHLRGNGLRTGLHGRHLGAVAPAVGGLFPLDYVACYGLVPLPRPRRRGPSRPDPGMEERHDTRNPSESWAAALTYAGAGGIPDPAHPGNRAVAGRPARGPRTRSVPRRSS